MSNELKCPFCNKPLQPTLRQSDEYWCENYDCPGTNIEWVGSQKLWQELIRTRKALDVATERLEQIAHESFQGDQQSINLGFHIRAAAALTDIEQITAEQKDIK